MRALLKCTLQKMAATDVVQDVTDVIGKFGLWQKIFLTLIAYTVGITTWVFFSMTFMAPEIKFNCVQYEHLNMSRNDTEYNGFLESRDECSAIVNGTKYSCVKWEYDRSAFSYTLVEKLDLVCDKAFFISLCNSLMLVAEFFGAVIFGHLSDKIGRRLTIFIILVVYLVSCVAMMFPENVPIFLISHFVNGSSSFGMIGTVLLSEIVSKEYRASTNSLMWMGWGIGYSVFPGVAYLLTDWFNLQIAITCASIPLLALFWLTPESPRWLIVKDNKKEAEKHMTRAAKWNKLPVAGIKEHVDTLSEILKNSVANENCRDYTFFQFIKCRKSMCRTCFVGLVWMTNSLVYYGISMNSEIFGGNMYLNFFLLGIIEIPAATLTCFFSHHWNRRPLLYSSLMASGIASILVYFVANSFTPIRLTLVVIVKFSITFAYNMIYIYTPEVFPTGIRSGGMAVGMCLSRVSGFFAPFIKEMQRSIGLGNAMVLLGSIGVTVGCLVFLFLPETKGLKLPDTLEESEAIGLHKFQLRCRRKNKNVTQGALHYENGQYCPSYGTSQILHTVSERLT